MRNNATRAERLLWQELKNSKIGYKFRRQQGIGKYIADFCCPEVRVIVELDGEVHNIEAVNRKDYIRDRYLESLSYKIVRIENFDVFNNLDEVVNYLRNICNLRIKNI